MPAAHYLVHILHCALIDNTLKNFTLHIDKYINILVSNKYYSAYLACARVLHKLGRIK
jgi:hypothetical protein